MALGEESDEHVLGVVGVLVLVDEDVAEPLLVVGEDVGERLEQLDGQHEDVVEVERGGLDEALLVQPVDVRDLVVVEARARPGERLEIDELVLRRGDRSTDRAGWEALGVEIEVANTQRDEPQRVRLVVDGERRPVAEAVRLPAQDPAARGVEGRHPHVLRHRADEGGDPLLHLPRRLVREGDREDRPWRDVEIADEVGDAVGEDPRLPGPGTGNDKDRALGGGDGFPLRRVEAGEKVRVGHPPEGVYGRTTHA